jgi:hypothetical protein
MNQVAIKYTNIFHCKTPKIYPNWVFWFENMPSGNPALQLRQIASNRSSEFKRLKNDRSTDRVARFF